MCWTRSGQPRGLPGLKECDSCSLSPQEGKVLLSPPVLPPSTFPAPALVRSFSCGFDLAENSFLLCSPLPRADLVHGRRPGGCRDGRQGEDWELCAPAAQICWISFTPAAQQDSPAEEGEIPACCFWDLSSWPNISLPSDGQNDLHG